jgi:hypothetical protein
MYIITSGNVGRLEQGALECWAGGDVGEQLGLDTALWGKTTGHNL